MVSASGGQASVTGDNRPLYNLIATNLLSDGYTVHRNALPELLGERLWDQSHEDRRLDFRPAGIGRDAGRALNNEVRRDEISWIDNSTHTGDCWIVWADGLKDYLNKRLFLGLDGFESHYAIYQPGGFYRRHHDAFRGQANRLLSLVIYLNRDWVPADAGQLVLFTGDRGTDKLLIKPEFGTLVVFLSEEIEHEVLVTTKDRHSIAGWFHTARRGYVCS